MEALATNVTVRLPNGASLEVPAGTSVREVAERIGPRLAKDAVAGKIDGRIVDLVTRLESDGSIEILTWKSPDAVPIYRHSTAHLTAQAVKRLFPEVQIGIGPPIENGYYYDFLPARPFTPDDLEKIEAEMRRIIAEDLPVERSEMRLEDHPVAAEDNDDPLDLFHRYQLSLHHQTLGDPSAWAFTRLRQMAGELAAVRFGTRSRRANRPRQLAVASVGREQRCATRRQ